MAGNGGAKPRHSELLAKDVPPDDVIPIIDRYLMFYIRTADKLQRTARWLENLPGGLKYLQEVVLEDKLGLCAELERQMEELVGTYFCEWTEVVKDPARRKAFQQFANTDETVESVEIIQERGQQRPTYWAKDSATEDFRGTKWTSLAWQPMIEASHFDADSDSPTGSSANVKRGDTQLAIFKVRGQYYATQQMCPHRRAFALSDGLIGDDKGSDRLWVSCPFHKRNFELKGAEAGNKDVETLFRGNQAEAVLKSAWVMLIHVDTTHSLFCASAHSRTQPDTPPLILCGDRMLLYLSSSLMAMPTLSPMPNRHQVVPTQLLTVRNDLAYACPLSMPASTSSVQMSTRSCFLAPNMSMR